MKVILALAWCVFFLYACTVKEDPPPRLTHCDGLMTDTTGTGDNGRVYMPSAFTPNGDGLNEVAKPTLQNITSFTFTIFDQLNRVVYTTTQAGQGWQPTSAPNTAITYYYRIQANTSSGRNIGACGELYLLTCFPTTIPRANFYFEDQLTPFGFTGVTAETMSNCP